MAVICEQFNWCGKLCDGNDGMTTYWPKRGRQDAVCWSCAVNVIGKRQMSRAALVQSIGRGFSSQDGDDKEEEDDEDKRYERAQWRGASESSESKREYVAKVRVNLSVYT